MRNVWYVFVGKIEGDQTWNTVRPKTRTNYSSRAVEYRELTEADMMIQTDVDLHKISKIVNLFIQFHKAIMKQPVCVKGHPNTEII